MYCPKCGNFLSENNAFVCDECVLKGLDDIELEEKTNFNKIDTCKICKEELYSHELVSCEFCGDRVCDECYEIEQQFFICKNCIENEEL